MIGDVPFRRAARPASVRPGGAWRRRPGRPWVLGHRGARHTAPENTLAAFDRALDEGADGVELDVRLDGDGRVVVIHDITLKRVTEGRDVRSVESLSGAQLGGVDVGSGERVPRLVDVLAWARERDTRLNIEVKRDVRRPLWLLMRVAALVRGQREPERLILSSFHPGFVVALSRLVTHVPVGWLLHDGQRLLRHAPGRDLLGAAAIHPQATMVTPRLVAPWQREGLPVNVWTVNEAIEARRLEALGVDTLISDCPKRVLDALRPTSEPMPET